MKMFVAGKDYVLYNITFDTLVIYRYTDKDPINNKSDSYGHYFNFDLSDDWVELTFTYQNKHYFNPKDINAKYIGEL